MLRELSYPPFLPWNTQQAKQDACPIGRLAQEADGARVTSGAPDAMIMAADVLDFVPWHQQAAMGNLIGGWMERARL